jgi:hypothetical protein
MDPLFAPEKAQSVPLWDALNEMGGANQQLAGADMIALVQ